MTAPYLSYSFDHPKKERSAICKTFCKVIIRKIAKKVRYNDALLIQLAIIPLLKLTTQASYIIRKNHDIQPTVGVCRKQKSVCPKNLSFSLLLDQLDKLTDHD